MPSRDPKVLAAAERKELKARQAKVLAKPGGQATGLQSLNIHLRLGFGVRTLSFECRNLANPRLGMSRLRNKLQKKSLLKSVEAPEEPRNPRNAMFRGKKTTFRNKASASGRSGSVARLTRRLPTPPRSKRALKGRSTGSAKPKPIVVFPGSK